MPRNTRNVWLEANIDGRASTLAGGPVSRYGGLSATIWQREDGAISGAKVHVDSWTYSGEIRTEARVALPGQRFTVPTLRLDTHRDRPGATLSLDLHGLTEAREVDRYTSDDACAAVLTFADDEQRDAFLSLLPAWREARAEVSA